MTTHHVSLTELLRVPPAPSDLEAVDPRSTPGFTGDKTDAEAARVEDTVTLSGLQERLFAEGHSEGANRSVLLVLQGMDTAGKGGTVSHVLGEVNPQGCSIAAFGLYARSVMRNNIARKLPAKLRSLSG